MDTQQDEPENIVCVPSLPDLHLHKKMCNLRGEEFGALLLASDSESVFPSCQESWRGTAEDPASLPNCKNEKKRICNPEKWKRFVRQSCRNKGQSYTTRNGRCIPEKLFTNEDCGCGKKCSESVPETERRQYFDAFYAMGSYSQQNSYICGLVKPVSVTSRRPRDGSRAKRSVTYKYYIHGERQSVNVCKKFFLQTFLLSDGRVSRALKKMAAGCDPGEDNRGKKTKAKNRCPSSNRD